MSRRWRIAGLLVLLAGGAGLVVVSGIVPVKASSGHWAVTEWLLHFAMRRSVSTHALGVGAPPRLDDDALVLRGAGHYEGGCRPCHGAPGQRMPEVPSHMTPHPPKLPPRIALYTPEELFYIVRHGIKFTGMPAWPAQERKDEVWAVVAFLLRLPELDAEGYRRLVRGEAEGTAAAPAAVPAAVPATPPPLVAEACARCHGMDGLGRGRGAFPKLAGQRASYLLLSLQAYARGTRQSGIMEPVATALDEASMRELALYYGGLPSPRPSGELAEPSVLERGDAIAEYGIPERKVPSCVDCHGPSQTPRNRAYPLLAGQYAAYLVLQLELFKEGQRGGSPYWRLMHVFAERLTAEEIRAVAAWYASLSEAPAGGLAGSRRRHPLRPHVAAGEALVEVP